MLRARHRMLLHSATRPFYVSIWYASNQLSAPPRITPGFSIRFLMKSFVVPSPYLRSNVLTMFGPSIKSSDHFLPLFVAPSTSK